MNLIELSTALPRQPARLKPDDKRPRGLWQVLPIEPVTPDPQYALRQLLEAVEHLAQPEDDQKQDAAAADDNSLPRDDEARDERDERDDRENDDNRRHDSAPDLPAPRFPNPETARMAAQALAETIKTLCPEAIDTVLDAKRLNQAAPELDTEA